MVSGSTKEYTLNKDVKNDTTKTVDCIFVFSAKVRLILEYIVEKWPFEDDAEKYYMSRRIFKILVLLLSVPHIWIVKDVRERERERERERCCNNWMNPTVGCNF